MKFNTRETNSSIHIIPTQTGYEEWETVCISSRHDYHEEDTLVCMCKHGDACDIDLVIPTTTLVVPNYSSSHALIDFGFSDEDVDRSVYLTTSDEEELPF